MSEIENNNENQTKKCPFCGEEILAVAKKCKHCGEFFEENTTSNSSLEKLDVNERWKIRFRIVEKQVIDGKWWKCNKNFWKLPISEKLKMSLTLYMGDFLSTLAACLFGPIYYLCKGMWLKAIIYTLATIVTGGLLYWCFFCFASYDYYRLKMYGKQW